MRETGRIGMLVLGAVVALAVVGTGWRGASAQRGARIGQPAPEITGSPWINGPPRSVEALRGRVVFIEFWTYGCVNCQNVLPHLEAWHERYEPIRHLGVADRRPHRPEGRGALPARRRGRVRRDGSGDPASPRRGGLGILRGSPLLRFAAFAGLAIVVPAASLAIRGGAGRAGGGDPEPGRGAGPGSWAGISGTGADAGTRWSGTTSSWPPSCESPGGRLSWRQRFAEFRFGDVRIHRRGRQVFRAGVGVRLTRKEFDLLSYLVEHRGEILTRERLLDDVWGYERFPTTRTVDTLVLRLRQKFEEDPERPAFILTVRGQGYRFAS